MQGSRQFKDFEEYLVPAEKFATMKTASELPLAVAIDCEQYLHDRLELLETQLDTVNRMAQANDLPDAIITESGLKITPLGCGGTRRRASADRPGGDASAAHQDHRTAAGSGRMDGFTRHFMHLKSGDAAKDKHLC